MKLLLLHGAAKASSRKKLIEIKQKFDPNNVVIFEEGSKVAEVADNLVATSLFTNERLVILENPDENFQFPISNFQFPITLVIWIDHEVPSKKSIMEWVREEKGEILNFPESKEVSVFPFLDLLAEGNGRAFLEIEKLKKGGFDVFYLITMIFYLLRNLVVTPKNAPSFVKQKLMRQRKRFTQDDLINLYKDILEIDFKIKSGLLEIPQAEFMLVSKFLS